jgi:hypothetical protein
MAPRCRAQNAKSDVPARGSWNLLHVGRGVTGVLRAYERVWAQGRNGRSHLSFRANFRIAENSPGTVECFGKVLRA